MRTRPQPIDVLVAALTLVACLVIQTGRTGATAPGTSLLDWTAVILPCVPLLWRSQWPPAVFGAVIALIGLGGALGARTPAIFLIPLVALYAVARHRPARPAWAAVTVTILAGLVTRPGWTAFIAVSVVIVAIAVIGINQRTRQAYLTALEADRDQRARLAVADERTRIAREMHDVVAHHLTVMVALSEGAAAAPQQATPVMTQVAVTGRQALAEMRRLVGVLRDDGGRTPQPGLGQLDELIDQVRGAGLDVTLTREGQPKAWGPGAELTIFRIVQEALTNTLKHVGPGAGVQVRLAYGPDEATIDVVDDGGGRVAREPGPADRHGLIGMAERAAAYGGRVDAGPREGAGWRVHARLRIKEAV
ncbi:sensor histidine kinase [Paractinoplanes lichenicola]|uniref:histidine kinase n=1 Tax=Paractinoplanes lichenicola TaxID=2802976 RepID=A0ABS1VS02_9ACTN|nr:histidine kinase [Actinoplanes lichenicola]MBL7257498.1 two-component sensor histidine kinase [Actinoplanes lichenicola]